MSKIPATFSVSNILFQLFCVKFKVAMLNRMREKLTNAKKMNADGKPLDNYKVFNELISIELGPVKRCQHGLATDVYKRCVQQKLVKLLQETKFLGELYLAENQSTYKIVAPLPKPWMKYLANKGIRVSEILCFWKWRGLLLRCYWRGVRRLFTLVVHSFSSDRVFEVNEKAIFLPNLMPNAIPSKNKIPFEQKNFVNWLKTKYRDQNYIIYCQSFETKPNSIGKRIKIVKEVFNPLTMIENRLYFIITSAYFLFDAFIGMLINDWKKCLLIQDEIELLYFSQSDHFGKTFIFCNQDYQFRPLWSYFAEDNGACVKYAFYSCNSVVISTSGQSKIPTTPGYSTMSWPIYLVWDIYQKNFLEAVIDWPAEFEIVGPVDSVDNMEHLPARLNTRKACALFDVSAFQDIIAADKGVLDPYYNVTNITKFLEDVVSCLNELNIQIYYKRKRPFKRISATAYHNFVDKLFAKYKFLTFVDPGISPSRVVDACDFVISIPYTSTALIGLDRGKESIYYDPTGCLSGNSELAHGCDLINNKKDLIRWLSYHL